MKKRVYKKPIMESIVILHESSIAGGSLNNVRINTPPEGWEIDGWTITPDSQLPQPNQNEILL